MAGSSTKTFRRMQLWGRVQGVFFRDVATRRGRKLGLAGYAQNLPDGSLEIVAEGQKAKVDALFEWAKRGPFLARVDRFEFDEVQIEEPVEGFEIKYD